MLGDLRYAVRSFAKSPGFAAVAIVALALGIGANTAIFSVVYTLLLKPLPFRDPDRLAVVWEFNLPRNRRNPSTSPGNFLHWREMNGVFSEMSAVSNTFRAAYTGDGEPEELPQQLVTASLFPMLGVNAALGRVFTPADDQVAQPNVALISDRFWRRRFRGDPKVINRSVLINGTATTIVGVMPPGFTILDKTVDLWSPLFFSAAERTPRGRYIIVVARMKDGVGVAQAQSDMTRVSAQLTKMFPEFDTGWTSLVVPLGEQMTGDVRPALLVMLGAVGFVLLIACANVANLLLARATTRQRELAVRAALGADRRRLVRQMLAESLLLSSAGGVAGLLLAWWALHGLRTIVAAKLPIARLEFVGLSGWVLLFASAIAIASGLLFGIVPALSASGTTLTEALREGGRTGTGARGGRARQTFVVVETALALMLLVGAGLLVRSFATLMRVEPGFDPSHTMTLKVTLPFASYRSQPQIVGFFDRLFTRVDTLPGVVAAGGVSFLPLNGLGAATSFTIEGREKPAAGNGPGAEVKVVTHDYFKAMGIPLLRGRLFDSRDTAPNTRRIVVSESLVKKYFGDTDPIGQKIALFWNFPGPDEIVGVVGDVRSVSLESEPAPATYLPPGRFAYPFMTVVIHTSGHPGGVAPSFIGALRQIDPNVPVSEIRPMEEVIAVSTAQRRLTMMLLLIFAAVALVLAAVGIYGVISYAVTQRTQEIGIRMALGAPRADVMRMVVGQAMVLTAIGVAAGAAGAWTLTRLMQKLLFGVQPSDPLTFVAVSALLAAVAAAAAAVPGFRATRVDPVIALRAE